jgi:hypothetical protein
MLLGDEMARGIGNLHAFHLGHHVAAPLWHHLAMLLGDQSASCVRNLFADRVGLTPADIIGHAMLMLAANVIANRHGPDLLARDPDALASPRPWTLDGIAHHRTGAVMASAGARVE